MSLEGDDVAAQAAVNAAAVNFDGVSPHALTRRFGAVALRLALALGFHAMVGCGSVLDRHEPLVALGDAPQGADAGASQPTGLTPVAQKDMEFLKTQDRVLRSQPDQGIHNTCVPILALAPPHRSTSVRPCCPVLLGKPSSSHKEYADSRQKRPSLHSDRARPRSPVPVADGRLSR